jgi:hypothetical protein
MNILVILFLLLVKWQSFCFLIEVKNVTVACSEVLFLLCFQRSKIILYIHLYSYYILFLVNPDISFCFIDIIIICLLLPLCLCFVTLCYVMLRYVMLCYVMLCYVMLCRLTIPFGTDYRQILWLFAYMCAYFSFYLNSIDLFTFLPILGSNWWLLFSAYSQLRQ